MNPNTIPAGATALATIANDGLLGGAPVESDAELLATYGDALSRRDRAQFGSTEDMTALELADRTGVIGGKPATPLQKSVAWAMAKLADPEYVRTLGLPPAFADAETTGRIGGQPDTEIPENGAVGHRAPETPLCPTAPKVYIPPGWVGPFCLIDTNVKRRQRSDAQTVQTRFSCGTCAPCLANWRYRKRHRFEWETSGKPEQTIVIVSGLIDDDVASAANISIGNSGKGHRSVFLIRNPLTYHWDTAVVFHDSQSAKVCLNIQRGRDRAGQDCTIETRAVSGAEIEATWVPTKKRTPGWHKPCRFVTGGNMQAKEREYEYNDGYVCKASDVPDDVPWQDDAPIDAETHPYADAPTDTNSQRKAKLRARNRIHIRRWLAGVRLDADALLTLRATRRAGGRGDWFSCVASGTYDGPRALVIDLALAMDAQGMLSLDAPDGLRLASGYVEGELCTS